MVFQNAVNLMCHPYTEVMMVGNRSSRDADKFDQPIRDAAQKRDAARDNFGQTDFVVLKCKLWVDTLLDAVAMVAEPVRLAYLWRPLLKDTDDDMVLETAINGRADVLVTLNLRDFSAAKGIFDVSILSPADAIEWMRKRP